MGAPSAAGLQPLWEASASFLASAAGKPRRLAELAKMLRSAPYGLKQGVIDFWIPIFLYINQQDFALYNGRAFVLNINKEVFELLQKRLNDFSVKTFSVSGVKLEFFKRYRRFLQKDDTVAVSADTLLETVKPFFRFYSGLNPYAKQTRRFDSASTVRFRDVLSKATDPAKTFFEDLPAALGYNNLDSDEFASQYLGLIRNAARELNACYDDFIDRIEHSIVRHLGLPPEYGQYKELLAGRYSSIDPGILTPKARAFLDRIVTPSGSKREFIEKLAIVITDRRLDQTKDSEEPLLIDNLLHMFSQLERFSAISQPSPSDKGTEAFSFELASDKGTFSKSQTYRLPASKARRASAVAARIAPLLTEDEELNIGILLKLLNDKLK